MKKYYVNVYSINPDKAADRDYMVFLDRIVVKPAIFTAKELVTNMPIKILYSNECDDIDTYEKYGYLLAVRSWDLNEKSVATDEVINKYIKNFDKSKFRETYVNMKKNSKDKNKSLIKSLFKK